MCIAVLPLPSGAPQRAPQTHETATASMLSSCAPAPARVRAHLPCSNMFSCRRRYPHQPSCVCTHSTLAVTSTQHRSSTRSRTTDTVLSTPPPPPLPRATRGRAAAPSTGARHGCPHGTHPARRIGLALGGFGRAHAARLHLPLQGLRPRTAGGKPRPGRLVSAALRSACVFLTLLIRVGNARV